MHIPYTFITNIIYQIFIYKFLDLRKICFSFSFVILHAIWLVWFNDISMYCQRVDLNIPENHCGISAVHGRSTFLLWQNLPQGSLAFYSDPGEFFRSSNPSASTRYKFEYDSHNMSRAETNTVKFIKEQLIKICFVIPIPIRKHIQKK